MVDTFLSDLKQTLDTCISEFDSIHHLFCKNPQSDFTRNRKITFHDTCRFMIEFQSKSLPNEVMDFFGHTVAAPSASAYFQQRQKALYKLRGNEETSFRELKYTIGLVNFHSRKKEFIIQEVYARMILYNFCELATNHAVVLTSENTKHVTK